MKARTTMPSLATLALAAALLVAGCGGSGDAESVDTTLTTSLLSKARFIKVANNQCSWTKGKMALELETYLQQHPNLPRSNSGTEAVDQILIPRVEAQLAKLRLLGAPSGDVKTIEAMWDGIENSLEMIKNQGISANAAIRHAFLPNGQRIYDYGLTACAFGR